MNDVLKPCPFCGKKITQHRNSYTCYNCGYNLVFDNVKWYMPEYPCDRDRFVFQKKIWNTRTGEEPDAD